MGWSVTWNLVNSFKKNIDFLKHLKHFSQFKIQVL